jgi:ArsR family transcriptional regulator
VRQEKKLKNENFYNLHADMCKTISNPRRQAILDTIRNDEMTVSELIEKTGISQANLSQHLAILRSKGVVNTRRDGNNVYYSISDLKIIKAYDLISEVLKDSATSRDKAIKKGIER